jgi:hypothetical protein
MEDQGRPVIEAALISVIRLMPSAMPAPGPSIMMSAAPVPTVVMATTAAHMSVTMTMAAPYEDDAVTAGECIRVCDWHRQRR